MRNEAATTLPQRIAALGRGHHLPGDEQLDDDRARLELTVRIHDFAQPNTKGYSATANALLEIEGAADWLRGTHLQLATFTGEQTSSSRY